MSRVRRMLALVFAGFMFSAVACSGTSQVTGSVVYKGAPLSGATVSFMTADGTVAGTGVTNNAGEFTLLTPQGKEGIPSGTYKVVVIKVEEIAGAESAKVEAADAKDIGKMMAGGSFPKSGGGPPGMPGMGAGVKPRKSMVPEKFGTHATTTLQATVPSKEPIRLDLGS